MILPDFKIRCSAIGKIQGGEIGLTYAQSKKFDELLDREKPYTDNMEKEYNTFLYKLDNPITAGMKTYCKKWMNEQLYKRQKEINSKYLDKGNFCEEWSVETINTYLLESNVKNEEYRENDFICGTADIVNDGIDDIKNSYDTSTFPFFEDEVPNKDYSYQLQGYMYLWNKKTARLIYTLNDLPQHLIEREARSMAYKNGGEWQDYFEACRKHFTYADIPQEYKIKIFPLEYDKDVIEETKERVYMCRKYIEDLIK